MANKKKEALPPADQEKCDGIAKLLGREKGEFKDLKLNY